MEIVSAAILGSVPDLNDKVTIENDPDLVTKHSQRE
eukprot:SAG11_NODE_21166_length_430_cov_1.942598_1_plen_35_part_01